MNTDEPMETTELAPQERVGTTALVMGAVAVALFGSPLLPGPVALKYFPLYLVPILGITSVVWGVSDLWAARRGDVTGLGKARAGIALGAIAIGVTLALIMWMAWWL